MENRIRRRNRLAEINGDFQEEADRLQQALLVMMREQQERVIPFPLRDGTPWTSANALIQYRFSWEEIHTIADALNLPNHFILQNGCVCTKIQGLCVVLHRLSFPRRFADAEEFFQRDATVLSRIFREVADFIYQEWKHLLLFDHVLLTPAYLEEMAQFVRDKGGALVNCWGFIDGTHIQICRPGENQDLMYTGHKKMHSIKYQCIALPNGMIGHLSGPYPGSQHDSSILLDSRLLDYLRVYSVDTNNRPMNVYGDEGYARRGQVKSPHRGRHLTQEQMDFNSSMRRPRLCVEWAFGFMANQWTFMKNSHSLRMHLSPIGQYYPLNALFSNIQRCLGRRTTTSSFYGMDPPTLQQYLTSRELWDQTRRLDVYPPAFLEDWELPDAIPEDI